MTGITSLLEIKKITERSWFQKKKKNTKQSELISSTDSTARLIFLPLNVKINQLGEDGVLM